MDLLGVVILIGLCFIGTPVLAALIWGVVYAVLRWANKSAIAAQADDLILDVSLPAVSTPLVAPPGMAQPALSAAPFRPAPVVVAVQVQPGDVAGLFVRAEFMTTVQRQIFDGLLAWLQDDVNARYSDRFVLLSTVPVQSVIKPTAAIPANLTEAMRLPIDFLICSRQGWVVPRVAIMLWQGTSKLTPGLGPNSMANAIYRDPKMRVMNQSVPANSQERNQKLAAQALQAAGVTVYLVTAGMALAWLQSSREFLKEMEVDLGKVLANSGVFGY